MKTSSSTDIFLGKLVTQPFSVSESQVRELIGYIETQQEHHRVKSFKEELIAILEKHQISNDPILIWK
jgi:hypothetical protein